jgi:hypothetical protein
MLFGGRSLHCHYPSKQSAVLLFSCHAQLFLILIHVTEGDTLLWELSRAQENFACCFYVGEKCGFSHNLKNTGHGG